MCKVWEENATKLHARHCTKALYFYLIPAAPNTPFQRFRNRNDRHQFLLQKSVCIRVATAVLSGFWEIEQGGGIGSAAVKYYSPTVAEGKTLTA